MTVFVKLINGSKDLNRVFLDEKAVNKDKLLYLEAAKAYYEYMRSTFENTLIRFRNELAKLESLLAEDTKPEFKQFYKGDIAYEKEEIKEYEDLLQECKDCKTDLDICSYYCRNNYVLYIEMVVDT